MDKFREVIRCPKCNSESISMDKKGFSLGKAVAGVVLINPVGALAGFIGSNKIKATCLACGKIFDPKDGYLKIRISPNHSELIEQQQSQQESESKVYTEEEIQKKFKMWDNLCSKGLITKSELEKRKSDFINKK